MKKQKWLRWDGSYDLNGLCNHRLTPIKDLPNRIKAIKERLHLLGFDCGQLDNTLDAKTKKALIVFNGYCNHPTIHLRPTGFPPSITAPRLNKMPDFQPADFPTTEEMKKLKEEDKLLTFDVEVGDLPWKDPEWDEKNPYYDDSTIECLNKLFPEFEATEPPPPTPNQFQVFLSRLTFARQDNTATLNVVSPLAVKIISTPESILPFKEYGGIKIEINGYERVKSLMIRIYRSYTKIEDETSIPGEKIVYQEILNEAEIKALPIADLIDNKGKHHEARAHILRQNTGGGLSGSFGIFYGLFYERIDAPYKVRVWVSETADFFNKYKPADKTRKFIPKTKTVVGYLDTDETLQVRRLRIDVLEDLTPPSVTEPNIDHIKTVHDKSNIAIEDISENLLIENNKELKKKWNKILEDNVAIRQHRMWTEKDTIKTNLIEKVCPTHDKTFLRNNQIKKENYPDEIKKDPLKTYWEARDKLDKDGENFKFDELKEVCDNVKRHINIVKRRICCGQWSHLDDELKTKINQTFDNTVIPELSDLESKTYPYKDTLFFLNKFISFFSFVVYKAVDEIEYKFYEKWGIGDIGAGASQVRDRRAKIKGGHMIATELNRFYMEPIYKDIEPEKTYHIHPKTTGNSIKIMQEKVNEVMVEKKRTDVGKVIMVPSYNPLNPQYFNRIRAVPLFLQGMLDMQYLIADEIPQTPIGFMDHDAFHVAGKQSGGGAVQQWETLYHRLCELTGEPHNLTEKQVYERWQKNINICAQLIEKNPEKEKKSCLEFLLFFVLHEPALKDAPGLDDFAQKFKPSHDIMKKAINDNDRIVVVPESTLIRNRLRMGGLGLTFMKRLNYDFFGEYANSAVPHLKWGFKYLHRVTGYLSDLPDEAKDL